MKIYSIEEACMKMNIFSMHRSIFVRARLVLGYWPTYWKSHTADHIIFRF